MREIKFRVWHKNGRVFTGLPNRRPVFAPSDDMIFSQFTGLKDKYGKEIYEGDIIRVIDTIFTPYPITEQTPRMILDVIYCEERAAFGCVITHEIHGDVYELFRFFVSGGEVEVIGNIYETPELLK